MRCLLLTLATAGPLGLLPLAAAAQSDPLKSPECERALASMEAARTAPAQNAREHATRLEYARREAAQRCLGAGPSAAPPPRVDQPPVRLPPAVITPPAQPLPPAEPLVRPPAYVPPPVVTACDAGGCWDSNGQRLNRAGAQLQGPQGVCTTQGGLLICP